MYTVNYIFLKMAKEQYTDMQLLFIGIILLHSLKENCLLKYVVT